MSTPQIQRAEKDSDDLETPIEGRKILHRGSSTSTALNKLFATRSDDSAAPSREPSYQKPSPGSGYLRCESKLPHPDIYINIATPLTIDFAAIASETASLPNHLYSRGLLGGRHSDINIKVFGETYPLHRIILDRAPFFASALSEPWCEASQRDVELHPEDIDVNITKRTFELALKRLYGCHDFAEEEDESIGLFATGCWLEMQDLIDGSVESILRKLHVDNLPSVVQFASANYYGKSGEKILASSKAMLSRDGWLMPLEFWDGIPSELIREVVGGDGFFVVSEWDRWILVKRLLDRRLRRLARDMAMSSNGAVGLPESLRSEAVRPGNFRQAIAAHSQDAAEGDPERQYIALYEHPDIEPLLLLCDEGVHYVHLEFEQLQYIRAARDILGALVVPDKIITNAVWSSMELRQRILNAHEKEMSLHLSRDAESWVANPHQATGPLNESSLSGNNSTTSGSALDNQHKPRRFWIPSADCNIIVGGNSDPVVTATSGANRLSKAQSLTVQPDEAPWFSDFLAERSATPGQHDTRPTSYSTFPPFRFAAEFPNPHFLKERKRVYSRTVFYAGSLWNVYIQKVKSSSKNPQLGVYLHRAKEREPQGANAGSDGLSKGSVDERIGALEREMLLRSEHRSRRHRARHGYTTSNQDAHYMMTAEDTTGGTDPEATLVSQHQFPRPGLSNFMTQGRSHGKTGRHHYRPSISPIAKPQDVRPATPHPDSNLPDPNRSPATSVSSSPSRPQTGEMSDSDPSLDPAIEYFERRPYVAALPSYVDARPTIKTYFKIYSPSKGGRMLSVYESAPDNFNFSQSWGWKSSTLMVDDDIGGIASAASGGGVGSGGFGSGGSNAFGSSGFGVGGSGRGGDGDLLNDVLSAGRLPDVERRAGFEAGNVTRDEDGDVTAGNGWHHGWDGEDDRERKEEMGKLRFMVVLGVV